MNNFWACVTTILHSIKELDIYTAMSEQFVLIFSSLSHIDFQAVIAAAATSFFLILAAEIGDKSQLVCMALAAKHRPVPVILGALFAFALLNALAVGFGKAISHWFPDYVIAATVTLLFALFGLQSLMTKAEETQEEVKEKSGHGIFFTTFMLITFAEFGDKTQLAVVALSSTSSPVGVWIGATIALGTTSALGVIAGRKLLKKIPLELLHKIGGIFFLLLSVAAALNAYQNFAESGGTDQYENWLKGFFHLFGQ